MGTGTIPLCFHPPRPYAPSLQSIFTLSCDLRPCLFSFHAPLALVAGRRPLSDMHCSEKLCCPPLSPQTAGCSCIRHSPTLPLLRALPPVEFPAGRCPFFHVGFRSLFLPSIRFSYQLDRGLPPSKGGSPPAHRSFPFLLPHSWIPFFGHPPPLQCLAAIRGFISNLVRSGTALRLSFRAHLIYRIPGF